MTAKSFSLERGLTQCFLGTDSLHKTVVPDSDVTVKQ